MADPLNLAGQRFGRLVAVEMTPRIRSGRHRYWMCRCDCGRTAEVRASSLSVGDHQSCGCGRTAAVTARAAGQKRGPRGRFA